VRSKTGGRHEENRVASRGRLLGLVATIAIGSLVPLEGSSATSTAGAASSTVWLCKPGLANDPCATSLNTTVEPANGSEHVVKTAVGRIRRARTRLRYPGVTVSNEMPSAGRTSDNVPAAPSGESQTVARRE
jgi:hypothetical protein